MSSLDQSKIIKVLTVDEDGTYAPGGGGGGSGIADGADVAQGSTDDEEWDGVTTSTTLMALTRAIALALMATGAATIEGIDAHDAVVTMKPVLGGGVAKSALVTPVADGDAARFRTDLTGRQVVISGQNRAQRSPFKVDIADTTTTNLKAAAGAGIYQDLACLIIANKSTTDETVTISDGTNAYEFTVKAGRTGVLQFNQALPHAAANTAWTATLSTTPSGGGAEVVLSGFYELTQ
jgi:hypothetical protein